MTQPNRFPRPVIAEEVRYDNDSLNPVVDGTIKRVNLKLRGRDSTGTYDLRQTALLDFLLDNEPIDTGYTYTPTYLDNRLMVEKWEITVGLVRKKQVDYTFTDNRLATEQRKVYDTDGTTILAQATITYSYTDSRLTGAVYTRDI